MKEASLKRLRIVEFQSYDTLEKVKTVKKIKKSVVSKGTEEGRKVEYIKHKGFF